MLKGLSKLTFDIHWMSNFLPLPTLNCLLTKIKQYIEYWGTDGSWVEDSTYTLVICPKKIISGYFSDFSTNRRLFDLNKKSCAKDFSFLLTDFPTFKTFHVILQYKHFEQLATNSITYQRMLVCFRFLLDKK